MELAIRKRFKTNCSKCISTFPKKEFIPVTQIHTRDTTSRTYQNIPFLRGPTILRTKEYVGKVSFKISYRTLRGISNSGFCKECKHHWFWFQSNGILYEKVDCPCFRIKHKSKHIAIATPSTKTPHTYIVEVPVGHYKYNFA